MTVSFRKIRSPFLSFFPDYDSPVTRGLFVDYYAHTFTDTHTQPDFSLSFFFFFIYIIFFIYLFYI